MQKKDSGFTLIELMIVLAIVAVLTAVAMPVYEAQMRKARMAEAKAVLLVVAARQQQYLLDTRSYAGTFSALGVVIPSTISPTYYDGSLMLSESGIFGFTATMALTPTELSRQGGTTQAVCQKLAINHLGERVELKADGEINSPSKCW